MTRPSLGRSFVHPALDGALIAGGLGLGVTLLLAGSSSARLAADTTSLVWVVFLANMAHFAASTVRLYTKPGAREASPFVAAGLPVIALAVLSICIALAGQLGPHLQWLFVTWSPYHYGAQAYGLAVIYSVRSGVSLTSKDKRTLRWIALLPFLSNALAGQDVGVHGPLTVAWLARHPVLDEALVRSAAALLPLGCLLPLVLAARMWLVRGTPLPVFAVLVLLTNAAWFYLLPPFDAFVWATVFHGLQYLVIACVFHVKEQLSRPANRLGPLWLAARFYAASVLLGYALFFLLPRAYLLAGFGAVESLLLVTAAINVHHFIVDAFIWRLRPRDSNREVVADAVTQAA